MSLRRIKAVLLQDCYLTIRSIENLIDIFYSALIGIVVFGFFSVYMAKTVQTNSINYLVLGMILWEIVRVAQFSLNMGSLNNLWSRNLSNMFITPLSVSEYLMANMISSAIKGGLVFIMVASVCVFYFKFNVFTIGLVNLILFALNLSVFAWSIGIIILGLIFAFGTRIQAFAWSLIYLFQPLCAVFYPVTALPPFLQGLAYAVPITYVFEGARAALLQSHINWQLHGSTFLLNIVYFIVSVVFFDMMFKKSKNSGQFSRSEG